MHHDKKQMLDPTKDKDTSAGWEVVWKNDHTGAYVLKPKVSSQEDKDDVEASILFAQARRCVVKLQRPCNTGRSDDATARGKRLEIKTIRAATKSAVDNALRKAYIRISTRCACKPKGFHCRGGVEGSNIQQGAVQKLPSDCYGH